MDLQNFIGFPLEYVIEKLKQLSLQWTIVESSEEQKKYDTLLVVKIEQQSDKSVKLWTDKFLLYI